MKSTNIMKMIYQNNTTCHSTQRQHMSFLILFGYLQKLETQITNQRKPLNQSPLRIMIKLHRRINQHLHHRGGIGEKKTTSYSLIPHPPLF